MREYKNITEQELVAAGYKKYKQTGLNSSIALYQKKTDNFFINADLYDFQDLPQMPYRFSFSWQALFTLPNDNNFNIEYFDNGTIEEIEQFFADVFLKMNCVPNN